MDEKAISLLRKVRTGLQVIAEPIDWAARILNNKWGYPPLWIRQKVGDLSDFEGSGGEYVAYLKLLCGLKPGDKLLDIGCGCGLVLLDTTGAGSLAKYLGPSGRYLGMDINEKLINWCKKNFGEKHWNCRFVEDMDKLYQYKFDVVLCKSLFTHLLPSETDRYLDCIRDRTTPGGRCLSTWFLLNGREIKGRYKFRCKEDEVAYERMTNKKLAVAYDEKWLFNKLKKLGFGYDVWYGSWRGSSEGLSFQDIIVLRK